MKTIFLDWDHKTSKFSLRISQSVFRLLTSFFILPLADSDNDSYQLISPKIFFHLQCRLMCPKVIKLRFFTQKRKYLVPKYQKVFLWHFGTFGLIFLTFWYFGPFWIFLRFWYSLSEILVLGDFSDILVLPDQKNLESLKNFLTFWYVTEYKHS